MNSSSLNAASLNGAIYDVSQRSLIICTSIVRVFANAVIRRRERFSLTVVARTSGIIEILTRETVAGYGVIARVYRKAIQNHIIEATINVVPRMWARMRLNVVSTTDISIKNKVFRRSIEIANTSSTVVVTSYRRARSVIKQIANTTQNLIERVMRRNIASHTAISSITVIPRHIPRIFHRSIEKIFAQVEITAYIRAYIRNVLTLPKYNFSIVKARVMRHGIIIQIAEAMAVNDASIFRQIPYDEPADNDKVFLVIKTTHLFYVRN